MTLKVSLKRQGSQFKILTQQLLRLNKEFVEIGHFKSQGKHKTSGMTYPELMALHHTGNPEKNLPARPVLDILFFRNRQLKDEGLQRIFKAWNNRKSGDKSDARFLNDIGKFFIQEEKKVFGSTSLAPNAVPPKRFNNPLILTGDLKSKVAFKTSRGKKVTKEK
jgi:hypothetical protein